MKRSRLGPGAKALARGSTFESKGSGLKRSAKRRPLRQRARGLIDRQAAEAWAHGARAKPCAVCKRPSGGSVVVQGHHVLYQQHLRRWAQEASLEFERLRWDERNRLPLCEGCHGRHHSGARPVRASVLRAHAPKVWQLAAEIDRALGDRSPAAAFLDRAYPGPSAG